MSAGLLDIFVAGVQKAGTTTLHAYLAGHPQLCAPASKELHYFDNETRDWASGDYSDLTPLLGAGRGFDCTPIYGFWGPSLARIRAYNPAAQLIFLYRDPFERAWSHWCMEVARGAESLPFAEAIRAGQGRMPADAPLAGAHRVFSYVERGFYGSQLARALHLFDRRQLLLLDLADLAARPAAALARVASFLGLAPFGPVAPRHDHRAPARAWPGGAPTPADHALLHALWAGDMALFASLSGMDVGRWGFAPSP